MSATEWQGKRNEIRIKAKLPEHQTKGGYRGYSRNMLDTTMIIGNCYTRQQNALHPIIPNCDITVKVEKCIRDSFELFLNVLNGDCLT